MLYNCPLFSLSFPLSYFWAHASFGEQGRTKYLNQALPGGHNPLHSMLICTT